METILSPSFWSVKWRQCEYFLFVAMLRCAAMNRVDCEKLWPCESVVCVFRTHSVVCVQPGDLPVYGDDNDERIEVVEGCVDISNL